MNSEVNPVFGYEFDAETGGLLLNDSTPNSSKEPRPVYATEMRMLHMDEWFAFEDQNDRPYLWAEAASYYYRGELIARTKGGSLCEAPVMDYLVASNESGEKVPAVPRGYELQPVDVDSMVAKNADMMAIIEQVTVKKIYDYWKRYQKRLDCFHVAFSGGKDSMVLLELVKKALPHNAFMVVFGDTKMEFPDTYKLVNIVEQQCKEDGIAFYRAASHLGAEEAWRLFGAPSTVLRWCCSVMKSTPQTLKIRDILGKDNFVGADFVGVRAEESIKRSEYEFESYGKKQKGQHSQNPILDWNSAEVWLYIYSRKLPINEAYKKGNTRAGCLFCPMGRGKADSFRQMSYPNEIEKFVSIIRDMTDDPNIETYISNGGWASRKNGRDIKNNPERYIETERDGKLYIRVISPKTDWREWIKTLGDLPFDFSIVETADGYEVGFPIEYNKTVLGKRFKQVFRKAAYCIGCRVCEVNCVFGCIDFSNGLKITNCRHCQQCHEVDEGCLMYHSLEQPKNGGRVMKNSLNSYADHAPKPEWIDDFFDKGKEFFSNHRLGPMQISIFKKFLTNAGLIVKEETTSLYDLVKSIGKNTDAAWGLILINLAYNNVQIKWYIDNMQVQEANARNSLEDILKAEGVSDKDARSIMKAFKRLTETPLGTVLHFGTTSGKSVETLTRTKCTLQDDRVLLYALYRYAEACQDYYEFSLSRLMNTSIDSAGISPVKLFGFAEDEMITMLNGLSAKYPAFINVTFTHGLDKISLREDKTSDDVLRLFS
jgi:phosphoadenosine phosphosulfate reductase